MKEITPLESKVQSWGEKVKAQVQSGKSIRVFCIEHQLKQSTFNYWRRKFLDLSGRRGRFISISKQMPSAIMRSPRIMLPNGVQIDLGEQVGSAPVDRLIQGLCGVSNEKS